MPTHSVGALLRSHPPRAATRADPDGPERHSFLEPVRRMPFIGQGPFGAERWRHGERCHRTNFNYDGDAFFVRHASFTGADDPYDTLCRSLGADISDQAWVTVNSTVGAAPFPRPSTSRAAVKVINHYGDQAPGGRGREADRHWSQLLVLQEAVVRVDKGPPLRVQLTDWFMA